MEVVAVPSLPKQSHLYTVADEVINSLLDLQLEKWGLPPFADCKFRIPYHIRMYFVSFFECHLHLS